MSKGLTLSRSEAVEELGRYGITGSYIYLIDIIPLIELIWADGKAQTGEIDILNRYLKHHVANINKLAGFEALNYDMARNFADRFLSERPAPELLTSLRSLFSAIHQASENTDIKNRLRDSLLSACLDIASSSVVQYPYGPGDRFNPEEKRCFFEILDSL